MAERADAMMDVLRALAPYQDYGWFVALLAWTITGLVWTRTRRGQLEWSWVPWAAWPGAAAALIELFSYTRQIRSVASFPDFLYEDVFLGIAAATTAAGWIRALPGWGWLRVALIIGVFAAAGSRTSRPFEGALAITIAATLAAGLRWFATGRARKVRLSLAVATAGLWLTSAGPLASSGLQLRAWFVLGEWSALWSAVQALVAVVTMIWVVSPWFEASQARREWNPLLFASGTWLLLGLVLTVEISALARENFEGQVLARTRVAAALMDRAAMASLLGEDFSVIADEPRVLRDGSILYGGRVPRLLGPAAEIPRRELALIEEANPDILWAYFRTMRESWIVSISSQRYPGKRGTVGLWPVASDDLFDWSGAKARFVGFLRNRAQGGMLALAPLLIEDNQMLGWLVFDIDAANWVRAQAQPRLQAYMTIILGLGLAAVVAVQRVRTREREMARAAAFAAEQADGLKTALLAKVSHELRTPIQSVLGYGELLQGAISDPVACSRLAALRQHGELMLRLVNDLLDLSAIQAGAFRLVDKPTELAELVVHTVESLRPRAEEKGLALTVTVEPGLPPWVLLDAERTRQVVLNLVGNGIKFTDVGRVEVALTIGPAVGEVTLRVSDTGPGIERTAQARLFRAFERLDKTSDKEGTGLGLALSASLCRGMGGAITVESEPGSGATFRARFRASACAAPDGPKVNLARGAPLSGKRVLLADDNELVRELFAACLLDAGADCVVVNDGEAALVAAEAGTFDSVVLDVAMPGLNGIEVARRLRAAHGAGLRILGVSAHAGEQERREARRAGMDEFLIKPISLDTLLSALGPGVTSVPIEDGTSLLLHRMRARFREVAAAEGQALADAIAGSDFDLVRRRAHHLMSSAAMVRDDRLFMACAAAERAASEQDELALTAASQAFAAALRPWLEAEAERFPSVNQNS